MPSPGSLILVYDAEEPRHRRLVDRVGRADRNGLVVSFPYQNPELVRLAPELAGLEFKDRIYTLDTQSRRIAQDAGAVPALLRRLPAWAWAGPPSRVPFLGGMVFRLLRR